MYLFLSQKGKIGNPVFISLSLFFVFFFYEFLPKRAGLSAIYWSEPDSSIIFNNLSTEACF